MIVIARKGDILRERCDVLVLGAFSGTQTYAGLAKEADRALGGLLTVLTAEEEFGGKEGDRLMLHTHGKIAASRVLVVGLGDKKAFGAEAVRRALAHAIKTARKSGANELRAPLMGVGVNGVTAASAAQAATEGALLADYAYLVFKPNEVKRLKKQGVVTLALVEDDANAVRGAERGIRLADLTVRGTVYARDLVNEPASRMTPSHLKEHAEKIARAGGGIRLKILDRAACEKLGMGSYLSVARGSDEPPYFLHLSYRPPVAATKKLKKIVLIGKGITFDSGGLSLKPSEHMETMKCDMAGAAAVLGVFAVLPEVAPDAEVHGLIAATENMPGHNASKPGDMVTAMNGKSIEILNTDAEGRLTLADSLSYAVKKLQPDAMVDLATLTGACMVALGPDITGVMGSSQRLIDQIIAAAGTAGEPVWQLPLPREYESFVHGEHTDLRNTSRVRGAGAITAGLFLKQFAGETPWAHLDIAGPAFAERDALPYLPKGGTGFGVRTVLNYLQNL